MSAVEVAGRVEEERASFAVGKGTDSPPCSEIAQDDPVRSIRCQQSSARVNSAASFETNLFVGKERKKDLVRAVNRPLPPGYMLGNLFWWRYFRGGETE